MRGRRAGVGALAAVVLTAGIAACGDDTKETASKETTTVPAIPETTVAVDDGDGDERALSDACEVFTLDELAEATGVTWTISAQGSIACTYLASGNSLLTIGLAGDGQSEASHDAARATCEDGTDEDVDAGDAAFVCIGAGGQPAGGALLGDQLLSITFLDTADLGEDRAMAAVVELLGGV